MTPSASANTAFVVEHQEAARDSDVSAATGILVSLAISALFWGAIGYAAANVMG